MKPNGVVISVIIGIVLLELYALYLGYNGTLLKVVLIILAGLAGWRIPTEIFIKPK